MSRPAPSPPEPAPGTRGGSEMAWLRRFGIRPVKTRGQNFLIQPRVRDALISGWPLSRRDSVLEIGSGAGSLTLPLLTRVGRLYAVEKDERLCRLLEARAGESGLSERLCLVHRDVLDIDPSEFVREAHRRLIVLGNLPYSVTSPILLWVLRHRACFRWASVMVQKEYADRLLAEPGDRRSGSLTVWTAYHADVSLEKRVTRGAFWPRPEVASAVIRLRFHAKSPFPLEDPGWLELSLRACFGQRRKQLGRALASALAWPRARVEDALNELGIDPSRRGETLSLEEHCLLAGRLGVHLRAARFPRVGAPSGPQEGD